MLPLLKVKVCQREEYMHVNLIIYNHLYAKRISNFFSYKLFQKSTITNQKVAPAAMEPWKSPAQLHCTRFLRLDGWQGGGPENEGAECTEVKVGSVASSIPFPLSYRGNSK